MTSRRSEWVGDGEREQEGIVEVISSSNTFLPRLSFFHSFMPRRRKNIICESLQIFTLYADQSGNKDRSGMEVDGNHFQILIYQSMEIYSNSASCGGEVENCERCACGGVWVDDLSIKRKRSVASDDDIRHHHPKHRSRHAARIEQ